MKKSLKTIIFCVTCLTFASSYAIHPTGGDLASSSYLYQRLQSILTMAINTLKNRIFIGPLAGYFILPTQHLPEQKAYSRYVLNSCDSDRFELVENFDNYIKMKLVICYPSNWNKEDKSKCTVFCNPNGRLISSFINGYNNIQDNCIIAELLKNGPVVLFDYPNTGINYDVNESELTGYCPLLKYTTENQILDYSEAVLNYVAKKFDRITVAGISLGGAIATIILERYLQKNTDINYNRFKLINIDSFTSLPRVVMPSMLIMGDVLGLLSGVSMDTREPMRRLIVNNIKVFVFNHSSDRIIPLQARMTQYTEHFTKEQNVTSINSKDSYGHCILDKNLKKQLAVFFKKNN
jgi:hypothetical protein